MGRARMLSTALLVGLLVAVVLSPPGEGGQAGAAEPRTVTGSIVIPAAAFTPGMNGFTYLNNGWAVQATSGAFVAPLFFPVPEVNIRRLTIYAFDDVSGGQVPDVCIYLFRTAPATAAGVMQGQVCTSGTSGTTDPQVLTTTAISPRHVNTAVHGSYLWALIPGGNTRFYGVKITYSYEATP